MYCLDQIRTTGSNLNWALSRNTSTDHEIPLYFQGIVESITHWSNNHRRYVRCQLGFDFSFKLVKFTNSNIVLSPCSSSCVQWKINFFSKSHDHATCLYAPLNKLCGQFSNALFLVCNKICENPKTTFLKFVP